MWFKNLSLYRLPADFKFDKDTFAAGLERARMKPIGPLEPTRMGFVPVIGEALSLVASDGVLFALGSQERVLPTSVVNAAIETEVAKVRERTGRNPGKTMREQIKDKVLFELMPRAFVRQVTQLAYIDTCRNLLFVNATSDRVAESIATQLREGFGNFVVETVQTEESVKALLTHSVRADIFDQRFALGDQCLISHPIDACSTVKVQRHDLKAQEITEHIDTGKSVTSLGLIFENRISFALSDKFKLSKIKFLDVVTDEFSAQDHDGEAELDARFTLQVLEFRRLIGALDNAFKFMGG